MPDTEWVDQWWEGTYLVSEVASKTSSRRTMTTVFPPSNPEEEKKAAAISAPYHALLDSGASYSVVGLPWIQEWCPKDKELWKQRSISSFKQFRFGSGEIFSSLGSVLINAIAKSINGFPIRLVLMLGVIDFPIPLLLSRRSLARMRAKLDFSTNVIQIDKDVKISTFVSSGGHISPQYNRLRFPC